MNQAERIIAKFGSPYELAKHIDRDPASIYRWTYPRPEGTGGFIPHQVHPDIMRAAAKLGIELTAEDWYG